jgi:hypothetical protein
VLVLNNLRDRIVVQVDGQMKTGRDVVIGALLGAEEFGFATAPLVVMGCVMMRVCHLNTCPVGVATQDPELRKRFAGQPEFVENFFRFLAEDVRELMAQLGFRRMDEMIGRVDKLDVTKAVDHWKAAGVDLSQILYKPVVAPTVAQRCVRAQDHGLDKALDNELLRRCEDALLRRKPVEFRMPIRNVNRTVGTILGSEVTRALRRGGSAGGNDQDSFHRLGGQSFGAFVPPGITLTLEGDANDYVGKGLSGGTLAVFPSSQRDVRARREHHRRQRDAVRRHERRGLSARRGRRAVRGAQQRRACRGRGRRRSRLRVHDRRQGRRPRQDRPEFRGGHERRRSPTCSMRTATSGSASTTAWSISTRSTATTGKSCAR